MLFACLFAWFAPRGGRPQLHLILSAKTCGEGGGQGGGVGGRVRGGGVGSSARGEGLRATHYYHMHTSRMCVWGGGGMGV